MSTTTRSLRRVVTVLVLFSAVTRLPAAPAAPSIGQIALGAGFPGDGIGYAFSGVTFTGAPVVLVQASRNGRPLASAADAVTAKGFIVRLWDVTAAVPLEDGAGVDMRYVAIIPGKSSGVAAASVDCADGETVRFGTPFSAIPVVVCCGYDDALKAPVLVAATGIG